MSESETQTPEQIKNLGKLAFWMAIILGSIMVINFAEIIYSDNVRNKAAAVKKADFTKKCEDGGNEVKTVYGIDLCLKPGILIMVNE